MIQCEVQSHDAYGTSPELFGQFFGVVAATVREILGPDWSIEIEDAWQRLLIDLDRFVTNSDQVMIADGLESESSVRSGNS